MDSENAGAHLNVLPDNAVETRMLERASGEESGIHTDDAPKTSSVDVQTDSLTVGDAHGNSEPGTREGPAPTAIEGIREGQQNVEHVKLATDQVGSSIAEITRPHERRELSNVVDDVIKTCRNNEEMYKTQIKEQSELRARLERLQHHGSKIQISRDELQTTICSNTSTKGTEKEVKGATYEQRGITRDIKKLVPGIFRTAGKGTIHELIELGEDILKKSFENEKCIGDALDDAMKEVKEMTYEVDKLKDEIQRCNPGEKKQLQNQLDQKERQVKILTKRKKVLEAKLEELTEMKDDMFKKACANEKCLAEELDEVVARLDDKMKEVDELNIKIKGVSQAEKRSIQKRLDLGQREVGELNKYKNVLDKMKETTAKAVEITKKNNPVNVEVSELREQLEPLAEQEIELERQSNTIKEELDAIGRASESAPDSVDNSAEEDPSENNGLELQNIEKAIQDWTKTMAACISGHIESDTDNNITECKKAAEKFLSILTAHFQTRSTAPTPPLEFGLKTAHILDVMTDNLAGVITWKDWPFSPSKLDQQGILRVLVDEQQALDGRLKDCEKAFGESSAYCKYVTDETAAKKEKVNSFIEWLKAIEP